MSMDGDEADLMHADSKSYMDVNHNPLKKNKFKCDAYLTQFNMQQKPREDIHLLENYVDEKYET